MAAKTVVGEPASSQKEETKSSGKLPWWGKVLAGGVGVFLIVKFTPIMDILTMFFYVCMVPLFLFASLGLVSSGFVEAFANGYKDTVAEINKRVAQKVSAAQAA